MKVHFRIVFCCLFFFLGLKPLSSLFGDFNAAGSDSTLKVFKALADAFDAKSGFHVNVSGGGSSNGAKKCLAGEVELAFLSRQLKDSEISDGLVGLHYAIDGVAVIISPHNQEDTLSLETLAAMFSGEQTTWVHGKPVMLYNRNAESGTREVFEKIVMQGKAFSPKARILHDRIMMQNVNKIPSAIGYTSASNVAKTVKIVKINGVFPSPESLLSGEYPITRDLTIAVKGEPTGEIKRFLDFVMSEEGKTIIAQTGYLPVE